MFLEKITSPLFCSFVLSLVSVYRVVASLYPSFRVAQPNFTLLLIVLLHLAPCILFNFSFIAALLYYLEFAQQSTFHYYHCSWKEFS